MNLLKEIATRENKNIIMTIHQPSADIYGLIDRLLLLKNGQEIYQGPARGVISYLDALRIVAPSNQHVPDVFMQLLQLDDSQTAFSNASYLSRQQKDVLADMSQLSNESEISDQHFRNSFEFEFRMIARRSAINFFRNPYLLQQKIIQIVFQVIFIGSIWWQSAVTPVFKGNPTKENVLAWVNRDVGQWLQDIVGLLFCLGTSINMSVIGNLTLICKKNTHPLGGGLSRAAPPHFPTYRLAPLEELYKALFKLGVRPVESK